MAYLVLDDELAILFEKDVDYSTSIVKADGGEEDRNVNWTVSRRRWRLDATRLTDVLVQKLEMHFHMTRGRGATFLMKDQLDHRHWQVSTSPGAIAIGDGGQLVKYYGSGANQRTRTITDPISGTVKIDGVLATTEVDYETGIVTGGGSNAEFEFHTRVRFDSDTLSFTPLYKDLLHLSSSVELVEVRR